MGNSDAKIKYLQDIIKEKDQQILELDSENMLLKQRLHNEYIAHNSDEDAIDEIYKHKKNKDYKYLVFSGGAIRGITYYGALEVLKDKIDLSKIVGYAGTSVGAIASMLLAIGYTYDELGEVLYNIDYEKIVDDKWGVIRDGINILTDYGYAPGDYFYNLLGEWVEKKKGNKDYTFDDLYNDTGITLVVTGADINRKRVLYFCPNHMEEDMRNVPIRKGVRISMSIPWIFEPVKFNGCYCVDGAVLDRMPLQVFDGEYPGDPNARMNLCPPNPSVLGLNLVVEGSLEYTLKNKRIEINNIWEYGMAYIDMFMKEHAKRSMTPGYWHRTINLFTPDIPMGEMDISDETKNYMIEAGKKYTKQFFEDDEIMEIIEITEIIDEV